MSTTPVVDGTWRRNPNPVASALRLVRFSHTLFALPWALAGLILGADGWPRPVTLGWVLAAMVGARTAAMAFNRWADRRFDATNPRTAHRPSVTGEVSPSTMGVLIAFGSGLFVTSAYALSPLCGNLSWPTLALLLGYSYAKRFTSGAHLVLGVALGIAPLGAYLAARGVFDEGALGAGLLGLAVALWTAGFDILYACQDVEHDRREGLHSIPARLGIPRSLWVSRGLHGAVVPVLGMAGWVFGSGLIFFAGVVVIGGLLVFEHRLVRANDLSRVDAAFFQVNVVIACVMLVAVALDVLGSRS